MRASEIPGTRKGRVMPAPCADLASKDRRQHDDEPDQTEQVHRHFDVDTHHGNPLNAARPVEQSNIAQYLYPAP